MPPSVREVTDKPAGRPTKRDRQRAGAEQRLRAARAAAHRQRRRRALQLAGTVAGVVAIVALVSVGLSRSRQADTGVRAALDRSTHSLDFALPAFAGGDLVTSAQLKGTPTVINFYASWCTVCKGELPAFQAVHEQAGGRVAFLGVNPQSNDDDSGQASMIKAAGVAYPTLRDRKEDLLRLFNTTGSLPTTLFVNAEGTVVEAHNGGYDQSSLKAAIQQYLGVAV
jgi:thiol-disulfide isomerase/thioredoxin